MWYIKFFGIAGVVAFVAIALIMAAAYILSSGLSYVFNGQVTYLGFYLCLSALFFGIAALVKI